MPSPSLTVFIIEDNAWYSELLAYKLTQNPDYTVRQFASGQECLKHLASETPDLITLDYSLPDASGEQIMVQLRERLPEVPIIVISAQEDVSTAIEMLKKGAYDYFVKEADTAERLWFSAQKVGEQLALRRENAQLRQQVGQKFDPARSIVGTSPKIKELLALIEKAARTSITVSLSGETGTGKELAAKAIHYQSPRRDQPFVAVNVAAVPRDLIESELFGHEKGAFTGAVSRRVGYFEQAHGGTLFLDEIAELDLNLQAKLLRVLQERELMRVGGAKPVPFDARLMVATHRDLGEEVKEGRFRQDLYYRLLGLPIVLPPLRERGGDLLLLAETFLREFCLQNSMPLLHFSEAARQKLLQYTFPGNVRELKAVVELAAVLAEGDTITPKDLSLRNTLHPEAEANGQESLREQVAGIVQRHLDAHNGNILHVAHVLKIGKSTIYRMIQNHEVRVR
ncbi:sigma-54-dependent transcriptional regulator [Hymenobacter jeollabukensis]|uniref:Sigma-54-dependent Fis family transcriptional regulator n=1 Tax=Hymenobacter jeollabukensis TaxID=2025313 RepID=A0A5R8WSG6_9BACT|nr:sigma-54 dependent transcriptional regulator [Hymenobacter jeollabukensis]TLM94131.1 sigma-54-dependent Fis family transcriptional regulator [Hymenobacter jeollabukensis]